MIYKTQSPKTPHETLRLQEKCLPLQTNNVQVMLLQSEKMLEMNFPAIWRSNLQKFSLWCPPWEYLMEIVN